MPPGGKEKLTALQRQLLDIYGDDADNGNGNGVVSRKKWDKAMTEEEFAKLREETWVIKAAFNRAASQNDKKNGTDED